MNLSRKDIESLHADGAIALRGVVSEEWRQVLADAIEDDITNPGPFYHGYDIFSFDREPGDVYAFHALVLHGASGNASEHVHRRGYTASYLGDDVTYSSRPGTNKGLRNSLLKGGDRLDSEQYPLV